MAGKKNANETLTPKSWKRQENPGPAGVRCAVSKSKSIMPEKSSSVL